VLSRGRNFGFITKREPQTKPVRPAKYLPDFCFQICQQWAQKGGNAFEDDFSFDLLGGRNNVKKAVTAY
jgi:hypothetical protein